MTRQQCIVGKLHARRRGVPQPLLGNERCATLAPFGYGEITDRLPVDQHGAGAWRRAFTRERGEQLVLTIAGDAGYSQNLAAPDLHRDLIEPHAMRVVRLEREPLYDK